MFDRKDDLHMANTRKDSKGRGLHVGEQQRKDMILKTTKPFTDRHGIGLKKSLEIRKVVFLLIVFFFLSLGNPPFM